jgi:hypothetical protein
MKKSFSVENCQTLSYFGLVSMNAFLLRKNWYNLSYFYLAEFMEINPLEQVLRGSDKNLVKVARRSWNTSKYQRWDPDQSYVHWKYIDNIRCKWEYTFDIYAKNAECDIEFDHLSGGDTRSAEVTWPHFWPPALAWGARPGATIRYGVA